jgi:hypothetical protein
MLKISKTSALLAPTLILAGCAVAQIDVDVYKGPLVNHRDVQVQQFSAMAIGAKPLLVQLRRDLEEKARGDSLTFDLRNKLREANHIEIKYAGGFKSTTAERVNNLLSLYENREPVSLLDRQAGIILNDYETDWERFLDEGRKDSDQSWDNIKSGLKDVEDIEVSASKELCDVAKDVCTKLKALAEAYAKYLEPTRQEKAQYRRASNKNPRAIFKAHDELALAVGGSTAKRIAPFVSLKKHAGMLGNTPHANRTASWLFRQLAESGIVRTHADLLFEDGNQKKVFVEAVEQIANAFLISRHHLHAMLRINLKRFLGSNLVQNKNAPTNDAITRANPEVFENTVDLMKFLVGKEQFQWAIEGVAQNKAKFNNAVWLLQRTAGGKEPKPGFTIGLPKFATVPNFHQFLVGAFYTNPKKTAAGLLEMDQFYSSDDFPTADLNRVARDKYKKKRTNEKDVPQLRLGDQWYGLSRVIGSEKEVEIDSESLLSTGIAAISRGGSFAGGRTDKGLETLIEDYYGSLKSKKPNASSFEPSKELDELLEGLVTFSQKMLFVANHNSLLEVSLEENQDINRYVLVLQAVGNSILYQADELKQQASHRTRLERGIKREANAVNQVDPQTAGSILAALSANLNASKAKAQTADKLRYQATVDWLNHYRKSVISQTHQVYASPKPETVVFKLIEKINSAGAKELLWPESVSSKNGDGPATVVSLPDDEPRMPRLTAIPRVPVIKEGAPKVIPVSDTKQATSLAHAGPENHPSAEQRESVVALIRTAGGKIPSRLKIEAGDHKLSRDVLDQVIASLRQQHIDIVRRLGKSDPAALNIEQALTVALQQRSGMAYIRPSAAFLRTSFTASGLQDNVGTEREDLILQSAFRGLPILGGAKDPNFATQRQINQEIDKQFWQNVNRVRVTGSGSTNYAIAKDDVGNWYVKSYAADTSQIINSAKNLALFNLSSQVGRNLTPASNGSQNQDQNGAPNEAPPQQLTPLEKLFEKHSVKFDEQLERDRKAVAGSFDNLASSVKAIWKETEEGLNKDHTNTVIGKDEADAIGKRLEDAMVALKQSTASISTINIENSAALPPDERSKRRSAVSSNLDSALGEIRRTGIQVGNIFATADLPKRALAPKSPETKVVKWRTAIEKAVERSNALFGSLLRRIQISQESAIREFQTALTFIGDAAKQ